MTFNFQKDKLIILLLLMDLFFIILHLLFMYTDAITNFIFAIWRDRGPAEFFQYMKYIWVLALFLFIFYIRRRMLFVVYSLLFFYFLIDDFFEAHETVGGIVADYLALPGFLGLRPQDFGEAGYLIMVGLIFLILISIFHFRSDSYTRTVSKFVLFMVIIMAFFGMGMDMVGMVFEDPRIGAFFNLIEDGGEMLVMSFIVWFVFRLDPWSDEIPIFNKAQVQNKKNIPEVGKARPV